MQYKKGFLPITVIERNAKFCRNCNILERDITVVHYIVFPASKAEF